MRTTDREFPLVRCEGCGLLRLHPAPDPETLVHAYAEGYAPHVRPGISGWAKGVIERRSVRLLEDYLSRPKRVLDIGCATGDLLAAVRARGNARVFGIEPGARAALMARQRGIDVYQGELAGAGLTDGSFDTVLISHTLEHVPEPLDFLDEVNRVLSPGGAALIWIPNAGSIESRLFGRYWIGYDAPRHLTTFTAGTLGRMLTAAGFRIHETRHEAIGLEWAWAIRLMARDYVPALAGVLRVLHPLLIVLLSPAAFLSSRLRRSGRIRVIAVKTE
jgi:SAM-dependent methyltransferase